MTPHLRKWRSSSTSEFDEGRSPHVILNGEGLYRQIWRSQLQSLLLTISAVILVFGVAAGSSVAAIGPGLDIIVVSGDSGSVSYPGGKNGAGVYQRIISLMPPHDVYIEPFLGGGAVMRAKRPADLNIGCDLSGSAIAQFRDSAGGIFKFDDQRRRPSLELEVSDGIAKLERLADGHLPLAGAILIYCDPPYLMSTRSGKRLYEFEMSSSDHRRLLRCLVKIGPAASIMISGYASRMYERALAGWNSIQFESMTRGGYTKTEWLWFNFDPPMALHDYRYLGRDFRERERIKRLKQRWTARLERMPVLQRQALLSAIADCYS